MGRKKGNPAYMIEDPGDRLQAYKQLGLAICRQAVADYTDYLMKPDYTEEVKTALQYLENAKAIHLTLTKADAIDDDFATSAKEMLLSEMEAVSGLSFMRSETLREKLPLLIAQLKARNWKRGLVTTATQYVSVCKSAYVYVAGTDSQRKAELYKLERFICGEDFALYTGGIVDPEAVIAECKRCAKQGKRIFIEEMQ